MPELQPPERSELSGKAPCQQRGLFKRARAWQAVPGRRAYHPRITQVQVFKTLIHQPWLYAPRRPGLPSN
ncbi:MAG: hypothetical protein ACOYMN_21280, partial [Roseimicrobium sp.]